MLTLEGALAPILAVMVRSDDIANDMLDDNSKAATVLGEIKVKLSALMHTDTDDLNTRFIQMFDESPPTIVENVLSMIGNPLKRMNEISELIEKILEQVESKLYKAGAHMEVT